METYCLKCRAWREMRDIAPTLTKAGQPASVPVVKLAPLDVGPAFPGGTIGIKYDLISGETTSVGWW